MACVAVSQKSEAIGAGTRSCGDGHGSHGMGFPFVIGAEPNRKDAGRNCTGISLMGVTGMTKGLHVMNTWKNECLNEEFVSWINLPQFICFGASQMVYVNRILSLVAKGCHLPQLIFEARCSSWRTSFRLSSGGVWCTWFTWESCSLWMEVAWTLHGKATFV